MNDLGIITRVVRRVVSRTSNWTHEGYMDGLQGKDPDPKLSEWVDSDYNEGWLVGDEDRRRGVKPPKYGVGEPIPNLKGKEILIPKGTLVKVVGKPEKPAGKTYKVIAHHVNEGSTAWKAMGSSIFHRPDPPKVIWAGPGGYWAEAALEDVKW